MPLSRRKLILAKVEAAYATDPVHATTDAVLVHDFDMKFSPERYGRAVLAPSLTPRRASVLGKRFVEITFWQELTGNNAEYDATTRPMYDVFLRACGLAAAFAAGPVTWTYTPISTGFESVAIEFEVDGIVVVALGCRGNAKFVLTPGERGRIEYTFKGLFSLPADRALETPDYTDDIAPMIVAATGFQPWADNPTAGVFGHFRSLVLDLRNVIATRESLTVGAEGIAAFEIVGRGPMDDPGMAVALEVEQKANPNGDDFFTRWSSRTLSGAATATIGSGQAHNEHQLLVRNIVIEDIQFADFDGRVGHVLDGRVIGSADDNDISLLTT